MARAPPMPPWPSDLPSATSVTQDHPPSLPESSPWPGVTLSVPKTICKGRRPLRTRRGLYSGWGGLPTGQVAFEEQVHVTLDVGSLTVIRI